MKTDNSDSWLSVEAVAESRSSCCVVLTDDVFQMQPCLRNQAVESQLRRGELRSARLKDWVRERREVEHPGGLKLTTVSASPASWYNRYNIALMVWNMSLSKVDEISCGSLTTTGGQTAGTVGDRLRERREECHVFTVSLEKDLRAVPEEKASLAAVVSAYRARVKNRRRRSTIGT